jgi:RND family efflux transporter MFP subunit
MAEQRLQIHRFLWILALFAIVLAVWGVFSRLHARTQLRTESADTTQLTVVAVKPDSSQAGDELVLPGIVQAFNEAPIYARTSGYVKKWYTDIGAHVRKGQLLAEIETPEVDRQLSQAEADLATAQANLALSVSTNERWQTLLKTQSVSKQDADEKAGDTAAKKATTDAADQNVRRLRELESFKRLLAPFDGVVTARNTDIGFLINAGQSSGTELFRVQDTSKLRIYAQVPEAYAGGTKPGLAAQLQFPEKPGKTYEAVAVSTSHALDPTARTLQVELQLDNGDGELFPGAYAEVHFKMPSDSETMRIPANTIIFRQEGLQVATIDPQQHIKLKSFRQGRDFGKSVEVLSGLDPQDQLVVNPPDSITDGIAVKVAPPPAQGNPSQDQGNDGDKKPKSDQKKS